METEEFIAFRKSWTDVDGITGRDAVHRALTQAYELGLKAKLPTCNRCNSTIKSGEKVLCTDCLAGM